MEAVAANEEAFRITLCAVKEWAIINGVYSNVLGFLGGINFAILVAWVCNRHPDQHPPSLLRIFFRTFGTWCVLAGVSMCIVCAHFKAHVRIVSSVRSGTGLHLFPLIQYRKNPRKG